MLGLLAGLAAPALSAVIDRSKDATLEALGRGVASLATFDVEMTTAHSASSSTRKARRRP